MKVQLELESRIKNQMNIFIYCALYNHERFTVYFIQLLSQNSIVGSHEKKVKQINWLWLTHF